MKKPKSPTSSTVVALVRWTGEPNPRTPDGWVTLTVDGGWSAGFHIDQPDSWFASRRDAIIGVDDFLANQFSDPPEANALNELLVDFMSAHGLTNVKTAIKRLLESDADARRLAKKVEKAESRAVVDRWRKQWHVRFVTVHEIV